MWAKPARTKVKSKEGIGAREEERGEWGVGKWESGEVGKWGSGGVPDFKVLEFNYRVIQLDRLNWRDFLRYQNPAASALMAKMKIAPCDRLRVKSECLRLMATLKLDRARMRLISGFVDTYSGLRAKARLGFKPQANSESPL